jgi:hypothetical protein
MACGITSDYIYQRLKSTGKESKEGLDLACALLNDDDKPGEAEAGQDQKEEVKGGADGR